MAKDSTTKPNILLLFTDQQRYDALGCMGNPHIHTPNLDRLASEGCLYRFGHTPNPVCIPARYCLLTGQRSVVHRYYQNQAHALDPAIPTLPRVLSGAGYHTEAIGKMHFQPPRAHHGFHRMQLMEETPHYRQDDDYAMYLKSAGYGQIRHLHGVRHLLYHQPQQSIVPEQHHGTRWVADRTIEFLRENRNRAWFCWSSWIAPHPPLNAAPRWADFYRGRTVPPPNRRDGEALPQFLHNTNWFADMHTATPQRLRRSTQCYYAQVSFVDEQVGRVLDELDRLGLARNTLVVFASDHGELLGDHWGWQKQCSYDPVVRVPLMARFPGRVPTGAVSDDFVDLLDLLPTFADAAEAPLPGTWNLPGDSLLHPRGHRDRTCQFTECHQGPARWVSIRDHHYKYTYWFHNGYEQLWDLRRDPAEQHNLVAEGMTEADRAALAERRHRLVDWERSNGPAPIGQDLPDFGIAEYFSKRHNAQFPAWPANVTDPAEAAAIHSVQKEIFDVLAREPDVQLADLDLEWWVQHGGSKDLLDRIRRNDC
jgi:arylsulfatase